MMYKYVLFDDYLTTDFIFMPLYFEFLPLELFVL